MQYDHMHLNEKDFFCIFDNSNFNFNLNFNFNFTSLPVRRVWPCKRENRDPFQRVAGWKLDKTITTILTSANVVSKVRPTARH